MNILTIAQNTLIRNVRDVKTMVLFTLLPLLMIVLMGYALDDKYSPHDLPKTKTAYFSADQGELAKGFNAFLKNEKVADLLDVEKVSSVEEGKRLVEEGKKEAFLYVPASATDVEVYSNKELTIAKSLVDSFVLNGKTAQAVFQMSGHPPQSAASASHIEDMPVAATGKVPRAIDYYALVEMMQAVVLGALIPTLSLLRDHSTNTLARFQTAPLTPLAYKLGKGLGNLITLCLILGVDLVVTRFGLGVNWHGNWAVILGAFFLMAFLSVCVSLLIVERTKNTLIAVCIVWIGGFFLSTITGAFFKPTPGSMMEKIGHVAPGYYAQNAIFNTIYGGSAAEVASSMLVLAALAVLGLMLVILFGRRRFA